MLKQIVFIGLVGAGAAFPLESRRAASQKMQGYTTLTDVEALSSIDADWVTIETALAAGDYTKVKDTYQSTTTAGTSLQTLSKTLGTEEAALELQAPGTNSGASFIGKAATYWNQNKYNGDPGTTCQSKNSQPGCHNYADIMVMSAISKTGMMADATDSARTEMIEKTLVNHVTYMAAMEQLSHAMYKGKTYTAVTTGEDKPKLEIVKNIDTAMAYYSGKSTKLALGFTLSTYAVEFGLCFTTYNGVIKSFQDAQAAANSGKMDAMNIAIAKIPSQTTVPFVQGCIRYIQKLDGKATKTAATWKESAEAWAFCSALFPLMSATDASKIRTMVDPSLNNTVSATSALSTLENSYPAFGITKTDVGTRDPTASATQADIDKCQSGATPGSGSTTVASALVALFAATAASIAGARQ